MEVIARQQPIRADLLGRGRFQEALDELVGFQVAVAREAVKPVQCQVLLKTREPHKFLERCGAHLLDGPELHVIVHQGKNLLGIFI